MVTVIVPAHNAIRTIEETVRSVLAQTFNSIEVIVVDDGSTDGTGSFVEKHFAHDPRLRVLRQNNSGVAAARNAGIRAGTGKYVAAVDADDVWLPSKLEKQIAALEALGPSAGMAYCWTTMIDQNGNEVGSLSPRAEGDALVDLIFLNFVGHGSGSLMRRDCLDKVGLYDTDFFRRNAQGCEDWDLHLRIATVSQVACVPEYLVKYRVAANSMSRNLETMVRSFRLMQQKFRAALPEAPELALRWAESNFYQRQIGKAIRSGDFRTARVLLFRCWRANPARLLLPSAYRMLFRLYDTRKRKPVADTSQSVAQIDDSASREDKFNAYGRLEIFVTNAARKALRGGRRLGPTSPAAVD